MRNGFRAACRGAALLTLLALLLAASGCAQENRGAGEAAVLAERYPAVEQLLSPAAGVRRLVVPGDFPAIQEAIDAAAPGDLIVVDPGRYVENISFKGKELTLCSSNPADPAVVERTIIDGGGNGSVVTFDGGEGGRAALAGFTITGGSGSYFAEDDLLGVYGGGILVMNGSAPLIMNNVITGNRAGGGTPARPGQGGGVAVLHAGPALIGNTIEHNEAYVEGGGVYLHFAAAVILNSSITGNRARLGGGIAVRHPSAPVIAGNLISGNEAVEGGGVTVILAAPLICGNRVTGNRASLYGGGLSAWESSPEIRDNLFEDNSARLRGGALRISRIAGVPLPVMVTNRYRGNRPDRVFYQCL